MKRVAFVRKTPMATGAGITAKKPVAEPKVRTRKCALPSCRQPFTPRSMTHKCCGPDCAEALVLIERARTVKKERQAGLVKLKRRADYIKETQAAVNAYVRERDAHLPCISCGRWHDGQWHAGHFLSVGARPGLRFVESNIHRQCMPCNVHLSGNLINYRLGLINRIGVAGVETLEYDDAPRKHSIDELQAIRTEYLRKTRELRSSRKITTA